MSRYEKGIIAGCFLSAVVFAVSYFLRSDVIGLIGALMYLGTVLAASLVEVKGEPPHAEA